MLNADGTPKVSPKSDLNATKVVDVSGWAPTPDGLSVVENTCTDSKYVGFEVI